MGMTEAQLKRAVSMWGIAMCLLAAAIGWVFMRFGSAWSIADLPESDYVTMIVPAYVVTEVALIPVGGKLVDRYGCRPVLGIAPFIYIIASMLCIVSPTVECLIVFRFRLICILSCYIICFLIIRVIVFGIFTFVFIFRFLIRDII